MAAISQTPSTAPPSKALAALNVAGRLVLIGVILWLLLGVIQFVAQLAGLSNAPQAQATAARTPEIPWVNLLDGAWQLQGAPWQAATVTAQDQSLESRMHHPPDGPPAEYSPPSAAAAAKAVRFLRSMKIKPVSVGSYARYDFTSAWGRVVAFSHAREGVEQVALVRLALQDKKSRWRVVEIRPAMQTNLATVRLDALPPLPAGVEPLAQRYDRHGQVLAVMAAGIRDAASVAAAWRRSGWTVDEDRRFEDLCRQVVCSRGACRCTAWFMPGANQEQTLFIMATPAEGG